MCFFFLFFITTISFSKIQYSWTNKFNTCLDESDLLKNIRHYRRVHCPPINNETIPMVSQLPSGEIMIGVPHRAKFRSGIKCMGRELSGTTRRNKRKIVEIGDWFEVSFSSLIANINNLLIYC